MCRALDWICPETSLTSLPAPNRGARTPLGSADVARGFISPPSRARRPRGESRRATRRRSRLPAGSLGCSRTIAPGSGSRRPLDWAVGSGAFPFTFTGNSAVCWPGAQRGAELLRASKGKVLGDPLPQAATKALCEALVASGSSHSLAAGRDPPRLPRRLSAGA
jgi:hypothetical protein